VLKSPRESFTYPYIANALSPILAPIPMVRDERQTRIMRGLPPLYTIRSSSVRRTATFKQSSSRFILFSSFAIFRKIRIRVRSLDLFAIGENT